MIVIFNDRYSDNVGDGLIAECLEYGLRTLSPGSAIRTVDFGGRSAYSAHGANEGRGRDWAQRLWQAAPGFARRARARHRVDQVFRAQVAEALQLAEAVVIGGGQLVTGSSSFFADRLAVIAEEARKRHLPVHFHAVGVSDPAGWIPGARALLHAAFADLPLEQVSVRDSGSAEHWARAFGCERPVIAPDPALLARQAYGGLLTGAQEQAREVREAGEASRQGERDAAHRIGIGVIAPAVVDFLGTDEPVVATTELFAGIARAVIARGDRPVLFTNGSGEDCAFLKEVVHLLGAYGIAAPDKIEVAPRPATPAALLALFATLDGIVAHRLHANILAYALRLPQLGLGWDPKLRAFLASVGREQWLVTGSHPKPSDIAVRVSAALAEGIDGSRQAVAVGESWSAIGRLLGRFEPVLLY